MVAPLSNECSIHPRALASSAQWHIDARNRVGGPAAQLPRRRQRSTRPSPLIPQGLSVAQRAPSESAAANDPRVGARLFAVGRSSWPSGRAEFQTELTPLPEVPGGELALVSLEWSVHRGTVKRIWWGSTV